MENKEKLDLVEILKDCPYGTPRYSPLFGNVTFLRVMNPDKCKLPIVVQVIDIFGIIDTNNFTADGKYSNLYESECTLFPSKDCRDWSKFKAPKPEYKFKPFEKVLVRNFNEDKWKAAFFEEKIEGNYPYYLIGILKPFRYCIPYEGNEHLHNTFIPSSTLKAKLDA